MKNTNVKTIKRNRLKRKIRAVISGTSEKPRLSVFRSNTHIYVQIIDDTKGVTIFSASDINKKTGTKAEKARAVGKEIAEKAKSGGILNVVFDRNGFRYTGRVKMVADEARNGGLIF